MPVDASATRFLVVGFANTLAGLAVVHASKKTIGTGDVAPNATGSAIRVTSSFVLNRRWTFYHNGPVSGALLRFIAVLAVAYAANLMVVLTAMASLGIKSYLSQPIGFPVYAALSYIGSRRYAFPDQPEAAESSA
jgi:putative flippase GtrA